MLREGLKGRGPRVCTLMTSLASRRSQNTTEKCLTLKSVSHSLLLIVPVHVGITVDMLVCTKDGEGRRNVFAALTSTQSERVLHCIG